MSDNVRHKWVIDSLVTPNNLGLIVISTSPIPGFGFIDRLALDGTGTIIRVASFDGTNLIYSDTIGKFAATFVVRSGFQYNCLFYTNDQGWGLHYPVSANNFFHNVNVQIPNPISFDFPITVNVNYVKVGRSINVDLFDNRKGATEI